MDEDHKSPAETAGRRTRKASPRRLPKATQGNEVAKSLLRNFRPVQRFDSADYFMELHQDKQRRLSAPEASTEHASSSAVAEVSSGKVGSAPNSEAGRLERPPPLVRDEHSTSPSIVEDAGV